MAELVIPSRFCGPPLSGNGGWVSGRLAAHLASGSGQPPLPATVRLHSPPPLDRALTVTLAKGCASLVDGDTLVATATPALPPEGEIPRAVPVAQALAAAPGYAGLSAHPFPRCFVCGPDRGPEDGLRLGPAPLGDGRYAAVWRVPGDVDEAVAWAALDCPGAWAIGMTGRALVLGTLTVALRSLPRPGEVCLVMAQAAGGSGRKHHAVTALYAGADGPSPRLLGQGRSLWIEVDPDAIRPRNPLA